MKVEDSDPSTVFDAHMHLWKAEDVAESWVADMPALRRGFTESDYIPRMQESGISRAILVQAFDHPRETANLIAWADANAWVAGVIGWTDLAGPDIAHQIGVLADHDKMVGIRTWPMLEPDADWVAGAALDSGFSALAASRLCYDALVRAENLGALRRRLDRTPDLRVCINHCAYPQPDWPSGGNAEHQWVSDLRGLAAGGCMIKLSGFGHRTDGQWLPDVYDRHVALVLDIFGPEQVIWASNWPTLLTECDLADWKRATDRWLAGLSANDRDNIMWQNADRFYRLP